MEKQKERKVPTAKIEKVKDLKEKLTASQGVFFFDYSGLATKEIQDLKGKLEEAGAKFSIVKNTLLSKADEKIKLTGPTATLFSTGDPLAPLKAIFTFLSPKERFVPKGGIFESQMVDAERVRILASLPPKEVLYAHLAAQLKNPLFRLQAALTSPLQKMVMAMKEVQKKGGA